jgi:hypothetical protein
MTQFFVPNTAHWTGASNGQERSKEPLTGEPTWVTVLSVKRDRSSLGASALTNPLSESKASPATLDAPPMIAVWSEMSATRCRMSVGCRVITFDASHDGPRHSSEAVSMRLRSGENSLTSLVGNSRPAKSYN